MYFEEHYLIDTREVDHQGQCRPSGVLGFLQEAATMAAIRLGIDRETLLERHNCVWMLARIWVELERPLLWKEDLCVRTWHRKPRGASIYRDFDLYVDGKPVGQAVSTWVLADYDTRKLIRMDAVPELQDTPGGGGLEKTLTLARLRLPEEMVVEERRRLHYSEADLNGHVNNTRYADFTCDALRMERLREGAFVREMQIGFLAECRPGEILDLAVERRGETGFVRGTGPDGRARFEAAVTLSWASSPEGKDRTKTCP